MVNPDKIADANRKRMMADLAKIGELVDGKELEWEGKPALVKYKYVDEELTLSIKGDDFEVAWDTVDVFDRPKWVKALVALIEDPEDRKPYEAILGL